jgi:hypothetical protein
MDSDAIVAMPPMQRLARRGPGPGGTQGQGPGAQGPTVGLGGRLTQ